MRARHIKLELQHFDSARVTRGVLVLRRLILAYTLYRIWYPTAWALGSQELNIYLGGFNNSADWQQLDYGAGRAGRADRGARDRRLLLFTIALGLTFLVKFFEYKEKFVVPRPGPNFRFEGPESAHVQIFFSLYCPDRVHALHMIIGIGLMSTLTVMAYKKRSRQSTRPSSSAASTKHFVDIVWIFLFPCFTSWTAHTTAPRQDTFRNRITS